MVVLSSLGSADRPVDPPRGRSTVPAMPLPKHRPAHPEDPTLRPGNNLPRDPRLDLQTRPLLGLNLLEFLPLLRRPPCLGDLAPLVRLLVRLPVWAIAPLMAPLQELPMERLPLLPARRTEHPLLRRPRTAASLRRRRRPEARLLLLPLDSHRHPLPRLEMRPRRLHHTTGKRKCKRIRVPREFCFFGILGLLFVNYDMAATKANAGFG